MCKGRGGGGPWLACEVVLGLADIHPVARQGEGEETLVEGDQGKGLFLNAGRPELDSLQHLGAEDVDPRIDLVADKGLHIEIVWLGDCRSWAVE